MRVVAKEVVHESLGKFQVISANLARGNQRRSFAPIPFQNSEQFAAPQVRLMGLRCANVCGHDQPSA
jgi:hypothetical protein